MNKERKNFLRERYEQTLKQEIKIIRKTKNILEIERKYDLFFKYKKLLKSDYGWLFVIYFADYKNKEIEIISKVGDMTSLDERVIRAIKKQ